MPEPMAKWAVWAASPTKTTCERPLKQLHWPQIRRLKLSQAEPRKCRALVMSFAPSRVSAKICLAEGDRAVLVEFAEPMRVEGVLSGFDNEGRSVAIELVDVGLEPAVLGLAEVEGERVERLGDAEPDVAIGADDKIGQELIGVSVTDLGIEAVGGHDEVGVREFKVRIDVALEGELHAKRLATALQDVQELLAADADKAVSGRALPRTFEDKLDVVPMIEGVGDLRRAFGIRGAHRAHHRIGKDDAPAERVIGLVALDHGDGSAPGEASS